MCRRSCEDIRKNSNNFSKKSAIVIALEKLLNKSKETNKNGKELEGYEKDGSVMKNSLHNELKALLEYKMKEINNPTIPIKNNTYAKIIKSKNVKISSDKCIKVKSSKRINNKRKRLQIHQFNSMIELNNDIRTSRMNIIKANKILSK